MAMSGRLYTSSFQNVTLSAVQDLFFLLPGSTKVIGIQGIQLGQITGTSVANLRVRGRYLPATVTAGSGGSAATISKNNPSDAAATTTGRINDTTQATSSTTIVDLWDEVWNTINGYNWIPMIANRPPIIAPGGAFVLSLDTAPSSFVTNGSVTFEELS